MNVTRRWMLAGGFACAIGLGPAVASAAPSATSSVAARPGVVVEASVGQVDLEIEGWAKPRVELEGEVGGFTARLQADGDRVRLVLDGPGIPSRGRLVLRVPKGAELQVASLGGDVRGARLAGRAAVATISGDVRIDGPVTRVDVATTNGAVEVQGARGLVDIATVSGEVRARDVRGELRVESVSGKVDIDEVALDVARVSTVSSKVELAATLRRGPHRIETASGEVRVTVPRDAALRIFVTSFSGDIVDELGRGRESHARKHGRELGKGGGTLEIATFSGKVTLGAR